MSLESSIAFSQRDTGQQGMKPAALPAAVPGGPKLAGRRSSPQLQLTLGYSACSKGSRHMVPVAATSAGSQSIADIQDRCALEPAQMEQPAGCNTQGMCAPLSLSRTWGLSHCWPGILHSTHVNPFQAVWEGQVCHGDGELREGSLAAGPHFPWAISPWLTLYWGELGELLHRGSLAKLSLRTGMGRDMNSKSLSSVKQRSHTCARYPREWGHFVGERDDSNNRAHHTNKMRNDEAKTNSASTRKPQKKPKSPEQDMHTQLLQFLLPPHDPHNMAHNPGKSAPRQESKF